MAVDRRDRDALLAELASWVIRDWSAPGGYVEVIVTRRRWLELVVERADVGTATEAAGLLVRLEPVAPSSRRVISRRFPGGGGG